MCESLGILGDPDLVPGCRSNSPSLPGCPNSLLASPEVGRIQVPFPSSDGLLCSLRLAFHRLQVHKLFNITSVKGHHTGLHQPPFIGPWALDSVTSGQELGQLRKAQLPAPLC